MQSPAELARVIEEYDVEQWFAFLDELDAVSRRRRERDQEPEQPPASDRDSVAAWLARQHFLVDVAIREIWYLPKDAPANEIRLLEVTDRFAGPESSQVQAIDFGLDVQGAPFTLIVADVTSDELERVKRGELALPQGWNLDENKVWRRRA